MAQRSVNYTVAENGDYLTRDGAPIHTRNFLLRLSEDLAIQDSPEILLPEDLPEPAYRDVQRLEDLRLFALHGALWCSATVRDLTSEGWRGQILAKIDERTSGECQLTDWHQRKTGRPKTIGCRKSPKTSCCSSVDGTRHALSMTRPPR